jgi:hypothetical protein
MLILTICQFRGVLIYVIAFACDLLLRQSLFTRFLLHSLSMTGAFLS